MSPHAMAIAAGGTGAPAPKPGRQARRHEEHGQREQGEGAAPQDRDDDELQDGQRERDEDVDHVAPTVDVDEHGEDQVPDPGAVGAVRVGQEGPRVGEPGPPSFHARHQAAALDR